MMRFSLFAILKYIFLSSRVFHYLQHVIHHSAGYQRILLFLFVCLFLVFNYCLQRKMSGTSDVAALAASVRALAAEAAMRMQ